MQIALPSIGSPTPPRPRTLRAPVRPGIPTSQADSLCRLAIQLTSAVLQSGEADILQSGRGSRRAAYIRQCAIYLAHVGLGVPLADCARAFGRDKSTLRHACNQIEDKRDCPVFDQTIGELEATACRWADAFLLTNLRGDL